MRKRRPPREGSRWRLKSEVARSFDVDPRTVDRWVLDGLIRPPARIGGAWRFPAAEVEKLEAYFLAAGAKEWRARWKELTP